jgi:hypothetical protein
MLHPMKLRAEVIINAPAEAGWKVVGERFGQICEWAKPIYVVLPGR